MTRGGWGWLPAPVIVADVHRLIRHHLIPALAVDDWPAARRAMTTVDRRYSGRGGWLACCALAQYVAKGWPRPTAEGEFVGIEVLERASGERVNPEEVGDRRMQHTVMASRFIAAYVNRDHETQWAIFEAHSAHVEHRTAEPDLLIGLLSLARFHAQIDYGM